MDIFSKKPKIVEALNKIYEGDCTDMCGICGEYCENVSERCFVNDAIELINALQAKLHHTKIERDEVKNELLANHKIKERLYYATWTICMICEKKNCEGRKCPFWIWRSEIEKDVVGENQ